MFLTPPTLTEDFLKKRPPQAKNFWGPFFQKFDGFWKKIRKINGFLAVLTVFNGFQCLHDEKKPAAAEKFGNPFFARRRHAKIFPRTFSFSSDDPPPSKKKYGDDVWLPLIFTYDFFFILLFFLTFNIVHHLNKSLRSL